MTLKNSQITPSSRKVKSYSRVHLSKHTDAEMMQKKKKKKLNDIVEPKNEVISPIIFFSTLHLLQKIFHLPKQSSHFQLIDKKIF